jgi:hypothetical protein
MSVSGVNEQPPVMNPLPFPIGVPLLTTIIGTGAARENPENKSSRAETSNVVSFFI